MSTQSLLTTLATSTTTFNANFANHKSNTTSTTGAKLTQASSDSISISDQAKALLEQTTATSQSESSKSTEGASRWETEFGLKQGTTILENGHKQITTIKDSKLTVLEYDNDKIIQKKTGVITKDGVVCDTDTYGDDRKLIRHMHTSLSNNIESTGTNSYATMTRDTYTYKDGKISLEMHDSMNVDAKYFGRVTGEDGMERDATSLEELTEKTTEDRIGISYYSTITEYSNGKVSKEAIIDQRVAEKNSTSRKKLHQNTSLDNQENSLSVDITSYDEKGNMLQHSSFSESLTKDFMQKQHYETSWYKDGKLIKTDEATYETKRKNRTDTNLPTRATTYEMLNMDSGGYATDTPLNSEQLLTKGKNNAETDPSAFFKTTIDDIENDKYKDVKRPSNAQVVNRESSIQWKSSLYSDGKLAVEQEDSLTVRENPHPPVKRFKTVTGLTEDKDDKYIHGSSHSVKLYHDNKIQDQKIVTLQEESVDDARGMTNTRTNVNTTTGSAVDSKNDLLVFATSLDKIDTNKDLAATKAQKGIDTTLGDLLTLFKQMQNPSTKKAESSLTTTKASL